MGSYVCGVCHRPLSKDVSVRRGIGPDCWAKLCSQAATKDKEGPLGDHFLTIIDRFTRHGKLTEEESKKWLEEAEKALKDENNGKQMAREMGYEAVHLFMSQKINIFDHTGMVIQDISNMFDLGGDYKEGESQEKALWRYYKKARRQNYG